METKDMEPQRDSRGKLRSRFQTVNDMPSETLQSHASMASIQNILKQYDQVGIIENLNMAEAKFLDITEFTDFADAMNHAKTAEVEFMKLPSKVRELFKHDVANWLDTAYDDDKRTAMVEAGLIAPEDVPEAVIPVVDPVVVDPVVDPPKE